MVKRSVILALLACLLVAGVVYAYNGFTSTTLGSGHVVELLPLDNGEAVVAVLNENMPVLHLYHMRGGSSVEYASIQLLSGTTPLAFALKEAGGVVHVVIEYADHTVMYHTWSVGDDVTAVKR